MFKLPTQPVSPSFRNLTPEPGLSFDRSAAASSGRAVWLFAAVMIAASGCQSSHIVQRRYTHQPWHTTAGSQLVPNAPGSNPAGTAVAGEAASTQSLSEKPPYEEVLPESPADVSADTAGETIRAAGGKLQANEAGTIVEIDLSFSSITDSQLGSITAFEDLAELDLTGTEIHDEAMSSVAMLKSLRSLKLKGTKISNQGLQQLSGLSNLMLLDASNTSVTDEGLQYAEQWSSLRYLSLNSTSISDAGLKSLATLKDLKGLSIINTAVTESGVRTLKESLPNCLIVARTGEDALQKESSQNIPGIQDVNVLHSVSGLASGEQLAQVIQLAGLQPHLAVHMSRVYSSRDQWQDATQILSAACAASPSDEGIHFALGEALARTGQAEESVAHFEHCMTPAKARYLAGVIMYERSLAAAERYFDEVVAADPGLEVAQIRRDRIQQELAALRQTRSQTFGNSSDAPPEIIPAPAVRTVSHPRRVPAAK